jgi:N-acetylglucosaminyldiphosphoundecaprenol N-acetyl-beta-D-mannosaminyltransferase
MAKDPVNIPGPLGRQTRHRRRSRLRRATAPLWRLLSGLLPRLLDLLLALMALVVLSPLIAVRGLISLIQTRNLFEREALTGRLRTPFTRLRFAGRGPLRGLAVWINVLRGDMAVVGPRPLTAQEASAVPVANLVRFAVRPGLISPFGLRKKVGIAHGGESALDRDFVYAQSLRGDLGLVVRSVVTGVLGGGNAPKTSPPVLNFFGIPILNTTMAEAVDWVIAGSAPTGTVVESSPASASQPPGGPPIGSGSKQMAFVNPDCLNIAWKDADYREALLTAERVIPDGIGIHIGCRMLGQALRENVNGTDMFPLLCEAAAAAGRSLYLLGARPGIAAATAENMQKRFPELKVVGVRDGYFSEAEESAVIDDVNRSGAEILLVAFGAPRQDLWLRRQRARLVPGVCMGVGGLFDFYSGRIERAPVWMREIGMEWLYRLMQEPGRMWRRYVIGNPLFLFRVWRQTMNPQRFALPAAGQLADANAQRARSMQ